MRFSGFFGRQVKPGSRAFRIRKARSLHGQIVRYVTEQTDGREEIIGRGGNISVRDEELLVYSSGEILMRARIDTLEAADLLSGDGVVLSAPGFERDGKPRKIVVYFVYYRK